MRSALAAPEPKGKYLFLAYERFRVTGPQALSAQSKYRIRLLFPPAKKPVGAPIFTLSKI